MVQYLHPASLQGASDQRHETRGGMRWPLCAKDVSRAPEAQAVPDPAASAGGHWAQAVRGKVRPPARSGASVVVVNKCHATRGGTEQASNTARGTPGDRLFRGD